MAVFHINVFLLLSLLTITIVTPMNGFNPLGDFNRSSFPKGFVFGTASSAYQYEGAAFEGGKGPSIWDNFTHKYPEKIKDRSNGDVAVDSYHKYKEDIELIKDLNMDAYRFSISWSRVLPKGKLSGGVNPEGIKYYNNLINGLLAKGLQPYVTLFHWDVPQALEDEYHGLLSHRIVDDFRDYAELCFKEFGDRVKHWITINEPWTVSMNAYAFGTLAPGRCSYWLNRNCTGGDSGTEPYLAAHNQLLAHSAAANLYRIKYKSSQRGIIGITLVSHWYEPATTATADVDASKRALDFMFGWYMNPLTRGEYPKSMRTLVGKRLPKFSKEESRELKGSFDFLGLNYYSSYYAAHASHHPNVVQPAIQTDSLVNATFEHNGKPLGPMSASSWLCIYPKGLHNLLLYTKKTYEDPVIYITENGNTSYFIRYIVCIIL
ncbi:variant 2, Beta-glucosidase 12 [Lathyrus oleraceus]|nr:variant 2, Beta-glucosidase 12 [Pisum sativum]